MQKKISIFSFFSGIGILDLAFEKNGYNIVFVNEYDNLFIESYRYARMQMNLRAPIYGYRNDSAERYARRRGKKNLLALIAQEREKGNLVGFIGGPPCPDFSVAGKNAGVDGENGRLTKIYFDIICRCHPDFFLFEKDSGFEWIGIIPAEWGLSKIGQVYRLRNTKVSDSDYPPLSVTNKGIVPQLNTAAKTNAHDDRKLVKKGDFAINSRSDRRGSCGISDYDGSVSLINTILAPLNEMNPGYYDWLFHTVQFGDEFYKFGHGIVDDLWTTGWQEMKKITIPTPPLPEQQRIADFLDTKCAEIDALTADIQTQIDTLEQYKRSVITETVTKGLNPDAEMKDSGIQWIGDMPAHWGVIRGKYILCYMQKPVRENDGVITCFRDGEVTLRSNRREDGFTMSDKEIGYQGIDVDDLVIHGMDGFAGAIGISDSRGKASPVLNVLDTDQCKRYIMYYLRSMAYSDVFLALATGIRVRSCDLRWNKLAELSYPVPPLDEQNAIVKHIDSVLSKADAVIADKKAQLATLDEYKKSLIFEYVTGKKEVPVS